MDPNYDDDYLIIIQGIKVNLFENTLERVKECSDGECCL